MIKYNLARFLFVVAMVSGGIPALAHGAKIQPQTVEAIAIEAHYDSGEAMAQAQVLIYAPDNSQEPWLTGTTDDNGKFLFTPEGDRPGNWEVMVRQAGHGAMVTVPVKTTIGKDGLEAEQNADGIGAQKAIAMASTNVSTAERSSAPQWISIGAVIWGFVGTALFFSKAKGQA